MGDPIIQALEQQESRRWLITGLLFLSVVLAIGLGSEWGGFLAVLALGCGIIGSVAIWNLYGKVTLNDENFADNAQFSTAAKEFASKTNTSYGTQFKLVSASAPFLADKINRGVFIITPKRYWLRCDGKSTAGMTEEIRVRPFGYRHDTTDPSANDEIISDTWEHETMSGDRDHRYVDNWKTYTVTRYGIVLQCSGSSPWKLTDLSENDAVAAFESFAAIGRVDTEWLKEMKDENQEAKNQEEFDRLITYARKVPNKESSRKVESLLEVMLSRKLEQKFLKHLQHKRYVGQNSSTHFHSAKPPRPVDHADDPESTVISQAWNPKVGDRVIGKWSNGLWYPGKIAEVKRHQFVVHFDDGDEDTLSMKDLKLEDG